MYISTKRGLLKLTGSRAVLYQLINSYGFSYEQVISIIKSHERAGAIFIASNWVLNIDRDYFIISKNSENLIELFVKKEDKIVEFESFSLQIIEQEAEGYQIIPDMNLAALDIDKLTFPLLIRNWRQGDYFSPLGMSGKKKVSDFMIDEKIPVNIKRDTLVVLSGDDIVWVLGWRISEYHKITADTRKIYQLEKVSKK